MHFQIIIVLRAVFICDLCLRIFRKVLSNFSLTDLAHSYAGQISKEKLRYSTDLCYHTFTKGYLKHKERYNPSLNM